MPPRPAASRRVLPTSPFQPAAVPVPEQYEVDDHVSHDRFGLGTVVGIENSSSILIDFGSGVQRIKLPNPKLFKL